MPFGLRTRGAATGRAGRAGLLLLLAGLGGGCRFDRSGAPASGDVRGRDLAQREAAAHDSARPDLAGRDRRPAEASTRDRQRAERAPDLAIPADLSRLDLPEPDLPGPDLPKPDLPRPDLPGPLPDTSPGPVALSFNGTDSRAEASDSSSLDITGGAITMEAWIKITGPDAWIGMDLVGRHVVDDRGWIMWHGLAGYANGYQWRFGLVLGASHHYYDVESSIQLPRNQWVHLAGTLGNNTLRIFVNGQLAGTQVTTGGINNNSNKWTIGCSANSNQVFEGVIDEVRISGSTRYTASFTVPAAPFASDTSTRGLWHLDENTGTTGADASGNANHLTLTKTTWTAGKF